MPGPGGGGHGGGGGRGGGFGGGGFGGGGHHGGGFGGHRPGGFYGGGMHRPPMGGGMHRPPMGGMHHRPMGGWHWRPRHYGPGYGGGGCCGSIAAIPIVLIFVVFMIFYMIMPTGNVHVGNGGVIYEDGVVYDEMALQDFADEQYAKEFGDSGAYEDNLLILFLTEEDCYDFYYIAWVGDHIATDINYMLGNNDTELGEEMANCINETNYKYSLDSNLAAVMTSMAKRIQELELESSYDCQEDHSAVTSHLTNYTELPLTESTVNEALTFFTDTTGIPVVIVVEDMEEVFGTGGDVTVDVDTNVGAEVTVGRTWSISGILIVVAIAVVAIVLIAGKKKKEPVVDSAEEERNKQYRQFDDQY